MDPGNGPIEMKPAPLNHHDAPPGSSLRGRVADGQGRPIAGATVQPGFIHYKDGSIRGGVQAGVAPLTVADDVGEYLITSPNPFASMDVKVEAKDFARKMFTRLTSGTTRHDFTLTEGAGVTGRIVWNGQALAGVAVGIVSTDRARSFTGNNEAATDAVGQFAFPNLPPNIEYMLYGIMRTLKTFGAITPLRLRTGGDGSQFDAGDLMVVPGHRLAGRVMLDDNQPIPAGARVAVGLEDAWDTLEVEMDGDGNFESSGIPSGLIQVALRVPGYRVSCKNESLDVLNPNRLIGSIDDDISNLVIFMEKGAMIDRRYDSLREGWPPKQPLRGMATGADRAPNWRISGRVTDAKTGQPVPTFLVTPGNNFRRRTGFAYGDQAHGINGAYAVDLSKRFSQPVLKIEAVGYLTVALAPPQEDRTDFEIALQPGSGPSGTVLLPDGQQAANVTVGLVCGGDHAACIRGGKVQISHGRHLVQTTDGDGAFSFLPELEMQSVIAASPDGFKLVSLTELAVNPRITLEPWGRVRGMLHRPPGPGINEYLDLTISPGALPGQMQLDAGTHTTTDEAGRFEFERVPPGKLDLSYRVKSTEPCWQSVPLQSITVGPGQTLELNIEAPERAAPDPAGFGFPRPRLERKIGPAITGTAVLPDGKPAAGIEVALLVPKEFISLGKGSLNPSPDDSLRTRTDGTGHFTLLGVEGAMGIVAVHELGFASIDLPVAGLPALTLQPWGEIHGTLRIGRRPGANQLVSVMRRPHEGGLTFGPHEFEARTDDRGRFVITYVPPGEQPLVRWIPMGGTSRGTTIPILVNVKAGEVTEVALGGLGWQVIGEAVFLDAPATFDWKEVKFSLRTNDVSNDAGSKNRHYHPELGTGGSFVFEDVLPGVYQLSAAIHRIRRERNMHFENIMPLGAKEVAIPDVETGRVGEPYNVGTLELRPSRF